MKRLAIFRMQRQISQEALFGFLETLGAQLHAAQALTRPTGLRALCSARSPRPSINAPHHWKWVLWSRPDDGEGQCEHGQFVRGANAKVVHVKPGKKVMGR